MIPRKILDGGESERPLVILTWNPDKWESDEGWERQVDAWPEIDLEWSRWSTGNRSSGISPGDHAILLRQGRERGIVAVGKFTTECFVEPHWDDETKEANFAGIKWHSFVHIDDRIPTDELIELVPEVPWNSLFASGVQAPAKGAEKVLKLCRERFGSASPEPVSNLPDPDAERVRLQGLGSWAHYMLSSLIAGGRPPGWNKPHAPSIFGEDLVRLIDEHAFGTSRPDRPEIYWEFKLNKRQEDAQNGWPDNAFVWPDRLLMIEIKTDPGSVRDSQASWYLQLGEANHPGRQIDLLFLTRDPVDGPSDVPDGARYANITWAELVDAIGPLADLMDEADCRVVERYVEMLAEFGILNAGDIVQPGPTHDGGGPVEGVPLSSADWLDEAISLAERTAADGVQRALDIRFQSWREVKLAADRVRDSLDGTAVAERVQAWRWRRASSGEPLAAAGAAVGWELRFSPLQR